MFRLCTRSLVFPQNYNKKADCEFSFLSLWYHWSLLSEKFSIEKGFCLICYLILNNTILTSFSALRDKYASSNSWSAPKPSCQPSPPCHSSEGLGEWWSERISKWSFYRQMFSNPQFAFWVCWKVLLNIFLKISASACFSATWDQPQTCPGDAAPVQDLLHHTAQVAIVTDRRDFTSEMLLYCSWSVFWNRITFQVSPCVSYKNKQNYWLLQIRISLNLPIPQQTLRSPSQCAACAFHSLWVKEARTPLLSLSLCAKPHFASLLLSELPLLPNRPTNATSLPALMCHVLY